MERVAGLGLGIVVGLGLGALVALLGAIPVMWLAGYLHDNGMTVVPAFSYGQSWVIALLLSWVAVLTTPGSGSSS